MSKDCSVEATPSWALTRTRFVLGPCASVGRQVRNPLVPTVNPSGPSTNRYERAWAGRSESVALSVKDNVPPSVIRRVPMSGQTGGRLDSRTITVNSCGT